MGKVYLVGAGPGDAGLITVKGLEKLSKCDAVVYDRLANDELLAFLKPGCEKIYVGKEAGKHYRRQDEINEILLKCAKKYNIVVRLKGGDSFVFGRGGEEIEALMGENIPYEVIPGVTSAVAVPECAGIPVTHRGVSRSFHVITGHTMSAAEKKQIDNIDTDTTENALDYDFETIAKMEGTLVFLMGLKNLGFISSSLINAGKAKDTPVTVISDGTTSYQRTVYGTLENIAAEVEKTNLPSPAVIVIGETAAYRYVYRSEKCKKVGITATDMLWNKLETGLEGLGILPVLVCKMQVCETKGMTELDMLLNSDENHKNQAVKSCDFCESKKTLSQSGDLDIQVKIGTLNDYNWLVFTSQNAVKLFFDRLRILKIDMRKIAHMRFVVLGSGTAAKLLEYGYHADFVPEKYNVNDFATEFSLFLKKDITINRGDKKTSCRRDWEYETPRILIPRALQGSAELTRIFDENGLNYTDLPIYDVKGAATKHMDNISELDYLVFVSASGVAAFFEELDRRKLELPETLKFACIGNITANRLKCEYSNRKLNANPPTIVANVNDVNGLINAMKQR
jgi:uroporphyrinogen III methyltransferase/synthase